MGNPFKLLMMIAGVAMVAAGVMVWILTARPPRDALGTLQPMVAETPPAPATPPVPSMPPAPKPAPTLDLPAPEGGRFELASYRGKSPVVIFFFATW
jgi:hypothetical protein